MTAARSEFVGCTALRGDATSAVHYCQTCEVPTPLQPDENALICPACGRVGTAEASAVEPIFVVTGASGSGKTTVYAPLARLLIGRCATFDTDWLLDSAGALSAGGPISWPAFQDAWLSVAHGVAQSGLPTVLLGPLIPERLEQLPARRWTGPIHYLLLDCSDETRRERIEARPPWRSRDIVEQTEFGQWLRRNIADQIDTTTATTLETARGIAEWVISRLPSAHPTPSGESR
jgi:hypothetical protein